MDLKIIFLAAILSGATFGMSASMATYFVNANEQQQSTEDQDQQHIQP